MTTRRRRRILIAVLAAAFLGAAAFPLLRPSIAALGRRVAASVRERRTRAEFEARVRQFLAEPDPGLRIAVHDPLRSAGGYNMVLIWRRIPALMDMSGAIVHVWNDVICRGRARLDERGNLLLIDADTSLREVDWEGREIWRFDAGELPARDFPHHDLIRLRNGNVLVPYREWGSKLDYLLELSSSGETVWRWHFADHMERDFAGLEIDPRDITHVNSVQELPENRMHQQGDDRFALGNILVSARNLNTVFIIDKESGEVVWRYEQDLDHQHEAQMIAPHLPGAGNILVFNNGLANKNAYRRSEVLELDPVAEEVVWRYASERFFSPTGGVQQRLPNGNTLICSSDGGRTFEVDPGGTIVWQWTPPFPPMRSRRYAVDFCPRLPDSPISAADLEPKAASTPFIDRSLYSFVIQHDSLSTRNIDGEDRPCLPDANECRDLLIPQQAVMLAGYGFATEGHDTGRTQVRDGTTFTIAVRSAGEDKEEHVLLEDTLVPGSGEDWVERELALDAFAGQEVQVCLDAKGYGDGNATPRIAFWRRPRILAGGARALAAGLDQPADELDGGATAKRQMEALGYVD